MAQYPNEIYTPREKENRSGVIYDPTKKSVIFAEDIKNLDDEVVAIEKELGTNPVLVKRIAVIKDIDLTKPGEYVLYTVPEGKKFRLLFLELLFKEIKNPAYNGSGVVVRVSDNKEAGYIATSTSEPEIGVSGYWWDIIVSGGDSLKLVILNPDSGDVYVVDIFLFGYLFSD